MKPLLPFLCLAVVALFGVPAESATRTVRSREDRGSGSLRQTLARARPGDTILLRTAGDLVLQSELVLDKDVTIRGVPAGRTRLDGGGTTRILRVTEGVTATLEGLTLAQGFAEGFEEAAGGALYNAGTLAVQDCTFIGNESDNLGGALFNSGLLMLDRCRVFDNHATEFGGGIYNAGTLRVYRTTLSSNSALNAGAAIHNEGALSIDTSTLSENSGISEGAIGNFGYATIHNSTLSTNHATTQSGAIGNWGELLISNSTLSRNSGDTDGAIANEGVLTLLNSTVVENRALGGAGGIRNQGTLLIGNSIVAKNRLQFVEDIGPDLIGTVMSQGHNLIGDSRDASGLLASDLRDVDPLLGPLQDNGGFTATHALRAGSPAIDAGSNALVDASVATDQRGEEFLRFVDGDGDGRAITDIGAFEHQGADLQLTAQVTGRSALGSQVTYTLTVRNLGVEVGEGVTVSNLLPNGAGFLSASTTQGTLTAPPPGGGGTVTVSLGDLMPGDTARIRITVRVPTRLPLANTAAVTSASFDPNLVNNQDPVVIRR